MAELGARRRRLGQAFAELYVRLRTEADSPARQAGSAALGTLIGCLPVYGLHLILCIGLARLLRLSRLTAYLAAHVNNPFTAPLLLTVEHAVGHLLLRGKRPSYGPPRLDGMAILDIGRDLLVGSVAVGVVLALVVGLVAFLISRGRRLEDGRRETIEAVSRRYRQTGPFNWEYVRGKLRGDPLYFAVVDGETLPPAGRLVDLGCGRGILLALLAEGRAGLELVGVDRSERTTRIARRALGDEATIVSADLLDAEWGEADVVCLFDVLHYLDAEAQERLIDRVGEALASGGLVLIREADRKPAAAFLLTRAAERLAALARGAWRQRFHYRDRDDWADLLRRRGFEVTSRDLSAGTPFSNVLIEGRLATSRPLRSNARPGGTER